MIFTINRTVLPNMMIMWLFIITVIKCVWCEAETESLHITQVNFMLQRVKWKNSDTKKIALGQSLLCFIIIVIAVVVAV